jgi:hypothetical protein
MTGRSLSLFALVGSLATLVLVATMTGASDATQSQDTVVAKSEPVMVSSSNPIPMPRSRAIYHFVRQQSDAHRVMLASYER